MLIVKNAKSRLDRQMRKYKGFDWSPTTDELHMFSVLTTILFFYDPIGIQNALDFDFSIESICDEYDVEAAVLLRCRDQWPDAPCLGHAIKEVLDHYFDENHPWKDCMFLAEQALLSIEDNRAPLNLDAIKNYALQHKKKWIPVEIK
jgi:hypothetical protein